MAVRVRELDPWDALTRIVTLMRPDWREVDVRAAVTRDHRPPRDVVQAAIAAAIDPDVRHPGAIAHRTAGRATPVPPNLRETQCETHLGETAAHCRGCAADRKAQESA